jgi:predicted metalloprotease with PDZ domain
MGTFGNSSIPIAWFTEGFTTYYHDLMLLRAGLLAFPAYVQHTNERLRSYFFSPAKNMSNNDIIQRHRSDSAAGQIVYTRGAVTALWLDWKIRESTKGQASLDTLMFGLAAEARGKTPPLLNEERILAAAKKYLDNNSVRQFQEYVEQGTTVAIPETALGPCAPSQTEEIPSFELGFNRDTLLSQNIVAGVLPESEAFRAGVRDRQKVSGTSIYWNDTSKPVKLTVGTGEGKQVIEYYPRGRSLMIPQYHLNTVCLDRGN